MHTKFKLQQLSGDLFNQKIYALNFEKNLYIKLLLT